MKNFRPLTILLCVTISLNAVAQQPSLPTATPPPMPQRPPEVARDDVVRITTNLVQVDAVITDKDGKAVTDLKTNEVQIFEDGKPQTITYFGYHVTGTKTAESTAKPAAKDKVDQVAPPVVRPPLKREDVHRTIAIVVDDLGLSFESISLMRRALKKFVDEQMQPGDLVAIIRTGGGVGALQQFSSDKRQLYAAIERVRWNPMGRADVSAFSAIRPPDLKTPGETENRNQTPEAFREEVFSVGTLGAINYVVRGLRDLPGRKSVLLVSDGLKIFNPGDPNRTNRVQAALDSLTELANRASVVIYTMDARGLTPMGLQAQDNPQMSAPVGPRGNSLGVIRSIRDLEKLMTVRRNSFYESQNGLNYLAEQTGGLAIRNTNNLSGGIQRVLDDQRGYYLIGYRPDESTFDAKSGSRKFHHLALKVTRKGNFNVRMRNGFLGVTDEDIKPAEKTTAQQLLSAISSPFLSTGINLQLTSLFANDAANGSFLRSLLHIDVSGLTFRDGPNGTHSSTFDVLAMTFGSNGVLGDYFARTYTIELPEAEYQRALSHGLVYNITVPIKQPGAYQFRMALRDAGTARVGSAGQFIAVPDFSSRRLTLSGIVLHSSNADSKPSLASAGGEGAGQNNSDASPAVRRFRQGTQMEWGYLIYNAQPDKITGKPQLSTEVRLFHEGKQVFAGGARPFDPTGQSDPQRLIASGALILGTDLPPGEYVLQVIVTDGLADKKYRTATQWMDFEIKK